MNKGSHSENNFFLLFGLFFQMALTHPLVFMDALEGTFLKTYFILTKVFHNVQTQAEKFLKKFGIK